MGGGCSRQKTSRVLIQGLDSAGKTTLLYRLKLGEVVTTIPTIGFNVETIQSSSGLEVCAWDLGGRDKIRPLYRHYYNGTEGLIFILDSADVERMDSAFEELHDMILHDDDLRESVVMVLANKQDLEEALSPAEIEARLLEFHQKCKLALGVSLLVMPCSATSKDDTSMWLAFNHFVKMIKMKKEGKCENGFIPLAWETASREEDERKAIVDSNSLFYRLKNSVFKDPFQLMKSFLFY